MAVFAELNSPIFAGVRHSAVYDLGVSKAQFENLLVRQGAIFR